MTSTLLQVASWEDRFLAGFRASLEAGSLKQALCLASQRYQSRTAPNCSAIVQLAKLSGVDLELRVLDFGNVIEVDDAIKWSVERAINSNVDEVIFDISTAPRHIIWGVLCELAQTLPRVTLRYVKAARYGVWQTDEDLEPRLVVNCSGVMYPDLPTCLIMMCGPNVARAEKMCYKFEPRKAIILRDRDAFQYGDLRAFEYSKHSNTEEISFNNKDYSDDNLTMLIEIVKPYIGSYNIVCSSFGPKLGAILLFRLIQVYPEIALSYVPAGVHNIEVSMGVSTIHEMQLDLQAFT